MQAFEYSRPTTREAAVKLLAAEWGQTEVLAGGTDLISAMKDRATTPRRVVSLQHVRGLEVFSFSPGAGLRLGAMVTIQELLDKPAAREHYPALVQAAEGVSSQQIRALGTVGGDLLQRPRCWYFRAGYGLVAQSNGKSLARDGDNRYHAIFGNSGAACFVCPSSLAPILVALGARAQLFGPHGARELAVEKLFDTPNSDSEREHTLHPNEILTEITVPYHRQAKTAVYEVRQKEALDWPLAAAAVVLHGSSGTVESARVVLGHVAPIPWPAPEAEQALAGKTVNEQVADEAGKASVANATPLSRNRYKVQLTRIAVKRAILRAQEGA